MGNREDGIRAWYRTPWGTGSLTVEGGQLVGVELPEGVGVESADGSGASRRSGPAEDGAVSSIGPETAADSGSADLAAAARWAAALEAYFRGEKLGWSVEEVPLDELALGDFERRVYRALLSVPPAVTVSYGTLAELAGYPRAARAVGNAMAANPIPVVIPCHRVVRSDGTLGRYGKDPAWKPRLLEHEATQVGRRT